ncbi:MAG: FAD-dependent oxidoreductase, partial [Steroidobacteraceae bacterium]
MKALIIGSGLIGTSSAYFLARRGWEVTVLDRQEGPGQETSFANGSLLTPGMPEPWNSPGSWRLLLKSLGRSDSPLQLRWKTLPGLAGWGSGFLRHSSPQRYQRNTVSNMTLALYSLEVLAAVRADIGLEYGGAADGS